MAEVARNLESLGRSMRDGKGKRRRGTPEGELELEISVVSERLDELRALHSEQLRSILKEECKLGTNLMTLESYRPRVYLYRFKMRDNLKKRLFELERERRGLRVAQAKTEAELQDRLLVLLRERELLGGEG